MAKCSPSSSSPLLTRSPWTVTCAPTPAVSSILMPLPRVDRERVTHAAVADGQRPTLDRAAAGRPADSAEGQRALDVDRAAGPHADAAVGAVADLRVAVDRQARRTADRNEAADGAGLFADDEVAVDRRGAAAHVELARAGVADREPACDQQRSAEAVDLTGARALAADREVAVDGRCGRVAEVELAVAAVADLEAVRGLERTGSVEVVVAGAARVPADVERDADGAEVSTSPPPCENVPFPRSPTVTALPAVRKDRVAKSPALVL